jgi:SAM-dependent methyltransferase
VGVEPSEWLASRGRAHGLDIRTGVLPHPEITGLFDVASLVDVVEHVTDPVGLLKSFAAVLKPDGVGCIVTPDVRSVLARLLGWNWWHFRIAHVGYFSIDTLDRALRGAGLQRMSVVRPTWHLPADYLAERALQYAPKRLAPPVPKVLGRIAVPVNLRDSLMVFVKRAAPVSSNELPAVRAN